MTPPSSLLAPLRGPGLRLCTLLALVGGLSACSSFPGGDPPLSDSTFSRLMIEMQVLSARDNRSPVPDGVRDSIFAHYGTDPEDFRATLRYYSRRPSEFRSLFSSTIDSLNAIEQRHRRETISSEDPQSPPR